MLRSSYSLAIIPTLAATFPGGGGGGGGGGGRFASKSTYIGHKRVARLAMDLWRLIVHVFFMLAVNRLSTHLLFIEGDSSG